MEMLIFLFLGVVGLPAAVTAQGVCNLPDSGTVELTGSCNFNNGVCGYSFPATLWHTHTESFGGLIYGKITGDDAGEKQTFALFQSNDPSVNDSVITNSSIISPVVYTSPTCLKFWFLMPNQNSRLDVYTIEQGTNKSTLVYQYIYKPASQWKQTSVSIDPGAPYRLEFRSAKENSYGYVGIDHIQVLTALTTTEATTTTTPTTTIPTTTTTTIPTTTTTTPTTTTTITTTTTTTTQPTTTMTEYETTEPTPAETTTRFVETTTTTMRESTTETTTIPTTTTTTEQTTTTTKATTMPNYMETSTTECICTCPTVPTLCAGAPIPTTTPVPPPSLCNMPADQRAVLDRYSCDFDHGMCMYDLSTYPHLWEYTHNRYGNPGAGEIIGDHSQEALGGYVLFNAFNNHVQNGTEHVFSSPRLPPYTEYCVSFWYNMPNNESRLQVNADLGNGTTVSLWERNGVRTNGWVQIKLAVRETSEFGLQFHAWKKNALSFVAVDDIQVSIVKMTSVLYSSPRVHRVRRHVDPVNSAADDMPGCTCPTCPAFHFIDCNIAMQTPPYERSCSDLNGGHLVADGTCDFDNRNSCKYTLPVYPHLWELVRYSYGNETVGVIYGDSSNAGEGLYAAFTTDGYHVPLGERGDMTSPSVMNAGKLCLSFRYNMPTDASTIVVFRDNGSQKKVLWSKSHEISQGWQLATILFSANETFQIAFSSEKSGLGGYFGIDDIKLYSNVTGLA